MFSHITIGITDFDRAAAFYDPVMAALGHGRFHSGEGFCAYGEMGGSQFWILPPHNKQPASVGNGSHTAFRPRPRRRPRLPRRRPGQWRQ